ncbi:hypothetical protein EAX61_12610 [Dokdonia sinensis]|uniref:Uncharacterized protein n=1 Tax=Dokdonia sinensis TaxID=2479847 RepID=A0A3M0G3Y5_9FLAO|nr:hypothetical protein [Dokdonia sinensis]RMB56902.1 hypothetical protein EAX61_12610 [Dokdonia sinensis]
MKQYVPIYVLFFVLATLFVGCQSESSELLTTEQESTALTSETETLLAKISLNDGSQDNILDGASCLEIVLPITVNVNNTPVTINNLDDLQTVELLTEEHDDDEDVIAIDFPIEITLVDHTKVSVNSIEELDALASDCHGDNEEDEDIESVDMRYPLSFPVFDPVTSNTDVRVVTNDAQLHGLMQLMSQSNAIVGLEFPVTLIKDDGTSIEIVSYDALESTVTALDAGYDEDDDTDYNDDDTVIISQSDFIDTITQCGYVIDALTINGQSLENTFNDYHFEFYDYQNIVTACIGNILYSGTWEVSTVNGNIKLALDIEDLPHINRNWIVHEFTNDNGIVDFSLRLGEDTLDFNMDCIDQTPDVLALLSNGDWGVYLFYIGGVDVTVNYSDYTIDFNADSTAVALNTTTQQTTDGDWEVANFGLELGLDFGQVAPLNEFNNEQWRIDYFDQNEIHLYDYNTGNFLLLEKL